MTAATRPIMTVITAPTRMVERAIQDLWTFAAINRMHIALAAFLVAAAAFVAVLALPTTQAILDIASAAVLIAAIWVKRRSRPTPTSGAAMAHKPDPILRVCSIAVSWLTVFQALGWGSSGVPELGSAAVLLHVAAFPHDEDGPGGWLQHRARTLLTPKKQRSPISQLVN